MTKPPKYSCDELGLCQGQLSRPGCACPCARPHAVHGVRPLRAVQPEPTGQRTDTPELAQAVTHHRRAPAYRRFMVWLRKTARNGG